MKNTNKVFHIYLIRNTKNGRCYVGQTCDIKHRFLKCHQDIPKMKSDLEKFGPEAFEFEILAQTEKREVASVLEETFADKFECFTKGYNSARRFKTNEGNKHSEASNAKRSASIKRLIWVHNDRTFITRRVTPSEAEALIVKDEGWHMGRFRRNLADTSLLVPYKNIKECLKKAAI